VLAFLAPVGVVVLFALMLDLKLWATAFLAATLVACALWAQWIVEVKRDRLASGARS
jgi:hypothetical protein